MGGGLFYSNLSRGLAIKYIPLRCSYLFDVVCAVKKVVYCMLTVCGRKNLSYRIRILAIYPI